MCLRLRQESWHEFKVSLGNLVNLRQVRSSLETSENAVELGRWSNCDSTTFWWDLYTWNVNLDWCLMVSYRILITIYMMKWVFKYFQGQYMDSSSSRDFSAQRRTLSFIWKCFRLITSLDWSLLGNIPATCAWEGLGWNPGFYVSLRLLDRARDSFVTLI